MAGEQLRGRRLALRPSQRQLAILLGVSDQTIRAEEPGKTRIIWPSILRPALETNEALVANDGLLASRSPQ